MRETITPRFDDYKEHILSLPADPSPLDVAREAFLLAREGRLAVFYAPLHAITPNARVVIVGLTPGRSQMVAAFQEARRLLRDGWHPPHLFQEIRRRMAFKGSMRTNLVHMLDRIGVANRLGLGTSANLFGNASHHLHSTSALRYPVFVDGRNYSGSPKIWQSPLLTRIVTANLPFELEQAPDAFIVPLGKAVEDALALVGFRDSPRTLTGFPHPSGANGHRVKQFRSERQRLQRAVHAWHPK